MTVDIPAREPVGEVASRARANAPARIAPLAKVVGSSTTAAGSRVTGLASRYASTEDALAGVPESPRELLERIRRGDYLKGDQYRWLEVLAKLFGYLVGLPVTIVGLFVVWMCQAFTRLLVIGFAVALVWIVAGMLL